MAVTWYQSPRSKFCVIDTTSDHIESWHETLEGAVQAKIDKDGEVRHLNNPWGAVVMQIIDGRPKALAIEQEVAVTRMLEAYQEYGRID